MLGFWLNSHIESKVKKYIAVFIGLVAINAAL
jgi:hypothetical protein